MIENQSIFGTYLDKLKSVLLNEGAPVASKSAPGTEPRIFHRILSAMEGGQQGESGNRSRGMTIEDYQRRPVPVTFYSIPQKPSHPAGSAAIDGDALERRMSIDVLRMQKGLRSYQRQSAANQTQTVAEETAPKKETESPAPVNRSRYPRQRIDKAIHRAAKKYDLPPELIRGVIKAESSFRADAVSPAGAQGLMQLMPGTARELGVSDPFDIDQNVDGGARYLKKMLRLFDGDKRLALAAYNAGPGTVRRYNGDVPYRETKKYVERVLKYSEQVA